MFLASIIMLEFWLICRFKMKRTTSLFQNIQQQTNNIFNFCYDGSKVYNILIFGNYVVIPFFND
jgi:hypothetical protein